MDDLAVQGIPLRSSRKSTGTRLTMTKSIGTVKYQHEVEWDRTEVRKALKVRLDASELVS